MSRDDDALGGPYYAPTLLARRRALIAELEAKVRNAEMTREDAAEQIKNFTSNIFAHHREHGSEPKP